MQREKVIWFASWLLRTVTALILLQTLYFKFTGAKESVYIFSTLGVEPWGRIATGVIELIAAILILTPRTVFWGASVSMGIMGVAIIAHLTRLGVTMPEVGDHGELFALAVAVFACSALTLLLNLFR